MARILSRVISHRSALARPAGVLLLLLGLALLGSGVGYWVYEERAVSNLDRLVTEPAGSPLDALPAEWREAQTGDVTEVTPAGPRPPASGDGVPALFGVEQAVEPAGTLLSSGAPPADSSDSQYRWADWSALPQTFGEAPKPTRIAIPAIGVDILAVQVDIIQDGDRYVWQRPKQSIGHHVGTARPGELGNVVISGHINSPVRGEGSVFSRLPEIPGLILAGEAVEVFVYTEETTYVYRVVANDVVDPAEVRPFEPAGRPTLTVITCVPDLVFSHRLVVTALLIKVADGGSPSAGQTTDGPVVAPLA